jgi:hypothetical protein
MIRRECAPGSDAFQLRSRRNITLDVIDARRTLTFEGCQSRNDCTYSPFAVAPVNRGLSIVPVTYAVVDNHVSGLDSMVSTPVALNVKVVYRYNLLASRRIRSHHLSKPFLVGQTPVLMPQFPNNLLES